jgi:hypothetical protein
LARPGFTKLGAKWVEVTVWGRMNMRFNLGPKCLKTWPATPVDFIPASDDEQVMGFQVGVAFPNLRRASRGRPAIQFKNLTTEDTEKMSISQVAPPFVLIFSVTSVVNDSGIGDCYAM